MKLNPEQRLIPFLLEKAIEETERKIWATKQ